MRIGAFLGAIVMIAGCGYQLVGRGGSFPAGVERVAVPIFENVTTEVEIAGRMTDFFIQQLLGTGKVTVVPSEGAQAVITGKITRYHVEPITFDTNRRALENRLVAAMDVSMVLTGETSPAFVRKGVSVIYEYPVKSSLASSRKEEDEALEYVSREMSQKIISLMTEGF